MDDETTVELPINGELDLHTFHPREVKDLVPGYLEECRLRGILTVRVVHGKGTGQLRRTVHSILEGIDWVESFTTSGGQKGGWGATVVTLRPDPGIKDGSGRE